jgi:hypothetical protein
MAEIRGFFAWPGACFCRAMAGLFFMGGAMSVLSNTVSSALSPTVVTAAPVTDAGNTTIYSRGGEFAQALAKVSPSPATLQELQAADELKKPDATSALATLAQASALADGQSASSQTSPTGTMAQLQQLLSAGGAQLQNTSRVALNITS